MTNRLKQGLYLVGIGLGTGVWAIACRPTADTSTPSTGRITILGSITAEGQDHLEQVLAPFTEATGIEVVYEGTEAFATILPVRVDAGNPPDLALFPQPGLMADFAREGELVPLDSIVERSQLEAAYTPAWLELGSVEGQVYGLWTRADIKSLVWYRPDVFQSKGYAIPQTWDEMMALSDQIVAEGGVPWCLGIENGAASGWVGTDWVEDILLRTAGSEVYDQWVTHAIPFTDERVKEAFERFGAIARNPDYVVGGSVGVISTPFGDAPLPLFEDPPGCYLHRQTNFIATFFPEDVTLGEDVDIFLLPEINPEFDTPVLVAGTAFALFNDTPETRALVNYLLTPAPHEAWVKLEHYVSPHQQVSVEVYTEPLLQKQAEILANANIIRFDGSDLMPGAVGTGTFWTGIVDYIGGADVNTVLEAIDASWQN